MIALPGAVVKKFKRSDSVLLKHIRPFEKGDIGGSRDAANLPEALWP